jgi:hypothetical protein
LEYFEMKILTTSDLAYVSGSDGTDSATGSFGDPSNHGPSPSTSNTGCINGVSQSTYNLITNAGAVTLMSPWEFGGPWGWAAAGGATAAMLYAAYCGSGG